jgi:hypothetical protein
VNCSGKAICLEVAALHRPPPQLPTPPTVWLGMMKITRCSMRVSGRAVCRTFCHSMSLIRAGRLRPGSKPSMLSGR